MGVTPLDDRQVEELLGAYALDACDLDEAEAVEAYLARNADAADEVARLRGAAAWVGATEALTPPPGLRDSVLAIARLRRGDAAAADPVLELYCAETARFDELVDGLADDVLDATTFNGLTVRDLVIHMAAQESMLAAAVGAPVEGVADITEDHLETRTRAFIARFHERPLGDARAIWARSVAAIRRWARATDAPPVRFFGGEFPREVLFVTRAFETWIHGDDIRRAVGRSLSPPAATRLHVMAEVSMQLMPMAMGMIGRERPGRAARVVLTGEGGGDWLVPLGPDSTDAADVVITADVVDWCLLVGERVTPDTLEHTVDGDAALAADLLTAAPSFATL